MVVTCYLNQTECESVKAGTGKPVREQQQKPRQHMNADLKKLASIRPRLILPFGCVVSVREYQHLRNERLGVHNNVPIGE